MITLDGREYELERLQKTETNLERDLTANNKIFSLTEIKKEIEDIVRRAKLSNPEVGKMDLAEHEIKLINENAKIQVKKLLYTNLPL